MTAGTESEKPSPLPERTRHKHQANEAIRASTVSL
jgi:hypothetical protein